MNALNTQGIQMNDPLLPSYDTSFSEQSMVHQGTNRLAESNVKSQISFGNPQTISANDNQTYYNNTGTDFNGTNKSVMFYKYPKVILI